MGLAGNRRRVNQMLSRTALWAALACLVTGPAYAEPQAPQDPSCVYPDRANNICETDFFRLAGDARSYDGVRIKLTGYAVLYRGRPMLFASRDLFNYSGAANGVSIVVRDCDRPRLEKLMSLEDRGVYFIGTFSVNESGHPLGWLEVDGSRFGVPLLPGEVPDVPSPEDVVACGSN